MSGAAEALTAELVDSGADPEIGQELIRVTFPDGRVEELHLHDYDRLYALPGVYETIVHDRLGCRSPAEIAAMIGRTADALGFSRETIRVLDVAAGNGVSGEALQAEGLRPIIGSDIVPSAGEAVRRDRPELYEEYLVLDLLDLAPGDFERLAGAQANVLSAVAVVGDGPKHLPPEALAAAAGALAPDALVAYMHTPGEPEPVTAEFWSAQLGSGTQAEELERRVYLHRRTVTGGRYELEGVVWRIRRPA
jgi:hypothetical protein